MAQIYEEHVVIKLSKLLKDGERVDIPVITPELKAALEEVAGQLLAEYAGKSLVIEVVDLGE
jgi:DUF1009 family protein